MLLILEIWLTVAAWRKGWRGWALLPLGIGGGIAILIGAAVGASGGSIDQATPALLLFDLACIGTLIGMVARAPRRAQLPDLPEARMPAKVVTGSAKM